VAGLQCGLGFAKTSPLVPPAERGLGNECGRASEIFDGDFLVTYCCSRKEEGGIIRISTNMALIFKQKIDRGAERERERE